jgi:hypothetical protein
MPRVNTNVVKQRSRRISKLMRRFSPLRKLVGLKNVRGLFIDVEYDDESKYCFSKKENEIEREKNNFYFVVGHLENYVKVRIPMKGKEEMIVKWIGRMKNKEVCSSLFRKETSEVMEELDDENGNVDDEKLNENVANIDNNNLIPSENFNSKTKSKITKEKMQNSKEKKKFVDDNSDEDGINAEEKSEEMWNILKEREGLGKWINVDVIYASRFYLIGIRSTDNNNNNN